MLDLSYMFKDMTDIKIKTTNPYSGQSTYLTKEDYFGNPYKVKMIKEVDNA